MSLQPKPLAFVDTETTGLNPDTRAVWEIAVIRRETDGTETEHLWQQRLPGYVIDDADPEALRLNRYHERIAVPDTQYAASLTHACGQPHNLTLGQLDLEVRAAVDGAVLVGSNPSFDAGFLRGFLNSTPWHYRTVDIVALAVGHLYGQAYTLTKQQDDTGYYDNADELLAGGWKSYELSALMGVEPPASDVAHTALGDARWARDVYDAITKPNVFARRSRIEHKDAA